MNESRPEIRRKLSIREYSENRASSSTGVVSLRHGKTSSRQFFYGSDPSPWIFRQSFALSILSEFGGRNQTCDFCECLFDRVWTTGWLVWWSGWLDGWRRGVRLRVADSSLSVVDLMELFDSDFFAGYPHIMDALKSKPLIRAEYWVSLPNSSVDAISLWLDKERRKEKRKA